VVLLPFYERYTTILCILSTKKAYLLKNTLRFDKNYNIVTEPPAVEIASFAVLEAA
jgi:hypothetical protein